MPKDLLLRPNREPVINFDAENRVVSVEFSEGVLSFVIEDFWSFSEKIAEYALITSIVVPPDGSAHE